MKVDGIIERAETGDGYELWGEFHSQISVHNHHVTKECFTSYLLCCTNVSARSSSKLTTCLIITIHQYCSSDGLWFCYMCLNFSSSRPTLLTQVACQISQKARQSPNAVPKHSVRRTQYITLVLHSGLSLTMKWPTHCQEHV